MKKTPEGEYLRCCAILRMVAGQFRGLPNRPAGG
jgi:hypothetical protein